MNAAEHATEQGEPEALAQGELAQGEPAQGEPNSPAVGAPTTPPEIGALRIEIDQLDQEILRLIKRRTEVSQMIGAIRMASGGTRIVVNREMDVLARFRELGPEGRQLGMLLLNLGRGRLGR